MSPLPEDAGVADTGVPAPLRHRLGRRLEYGRLIRRQAREIVACRGPLAEAAAWLAVRDPRLSCAERRHREWVAQRVSRMFAFVGIERQH